MKFSALTLRWYRRGWMRPWRFKEKRFREIIWHRNFDPRLLAFLMASPTKFPEYRWEITSTKRHDGSSHDTYILAVVDIHCRTWTLEQIKAYKEWTTHWWESEPFLVDVVVEDGRYDPRYLPGGTKNKDGRIAPHIHVEIDRPWWREFSV